MFRMVGPSPALSHETFIAASALQPQDAGLGYTIIDAETGTLSHCTKPPEANSMGAPLVVPQSPATIEATLLGPLLYSSSPIVSSAMLGQNSVDRKRVRRPSAISRLQVMT